MAVAGNYVSDPSNTANVSTSGETLAGGQSPGDWGSRSPPNHGYRASLVAPCPGLEVYPSRTQLPGLPPQPVLAGVVGGVCFLGVAVLVSILAACLMNRRRAARRRRKRLRQGRPPGAPPTEGPRPSTSPSLLRGPDVFPQLLALLPDWCSLVFPAGWGWVRRFAPWGLVGLGLLSPLIFLPLQIHLLSSLPRGSQRHSKSFHCLGFLLPSPCEHQGSLFPFLNPWEGWEKWNRSEREVRMEVQRPRPGGWSSVACAFPPPLHHVGPFLPCSP